MRGHEQQVPRSGLLGENAISAFLAQLSAGDNAWSASPHTTASAALPGSRTPNDGFVRPAAIKQPRRVLVLKDEKSD